MIDAEVIVICGLTAAALVLWLTSLRKTDGVTGRSRASEGEERRRGPVVVLVHGWRRGKAFWAPFIGLAQGDQDFSEMEFSRFDYRLGRFTRHGLSDVAKLLQAHLLPFKDREIILAGFGIGALVVREAYVNILREQPGGKTATGPQVTGLVLLAPPNHGLGAHRKTLLLRFRRLIGGRPLHDAYAGSDFIVNLRLGWLTEQKKKRLDADIAQMRAADDRYVGEEDTWDVHCLPERSHVVTGGHPQMARPKDRKDIRYLAMKDCILGKNPQPLEGVDPAREPPVSEWKTVLFLVPGIRDWGFRWRRHVRKIVDSKYPGVRVVNAQFGWFSTWDFLVRKKRRVRQWTDVYTRELAWSLQQPGVRMAVLAHSYGTYAVCQAMQHYRDIRVDRLYLAGCVLDNEFKWSQIDNPDRDQIGFVWNACAKWDFWVGLGSAGLRRFYPDLGSAGFDGFIHPPQHFEQPELPYGHGSFAGRAHLENALDFLLGDGAKPQKTGPSPSQLLLPIATRVSFFFPLFVAVVLAAIAALAWWLSAYLLPAGALELALRMTDADQLRIVLASVYGVLGCYLLLKYV